MPLRPATHTMATVYAIAEKASETFKYYCKITGNRDRQQISSFSHGPVLGLTNTPSFTDVTITTVLVCMVTEGTMCCDFG